MGSTRGAIGWRFSLITERLRVRTPPGAFHLFFTEQMKTYYYRYVRGYSSTGKVITKYTHEIVDRHTTNE